MVLKTRAERFALDQRHQASSGSEADRRIEATVDECFHEGR